MEVNITDAFFGCSSILRTNFKVVFLWLCLLTELNVEIPHRALKLKHLFSVKFVRQRSIKDMSPLFILALLPHQL